MIKELFMVKHFYMYFGIRLPNFQIHAAHIVQMSLQYIVENENEEFFSSKIKVRNQRKIDKGLLAIESNDPNPNYEHW